MKFNFQLAGAQFRPAEVKDTIFNLAEGDELTLEPEPTNAYDANAVRVLREDEFLGYVPKTHSEDVSNALAEAEGYTCVVVANDQYLKPEIEADIGA